MISLKQLTKPVSTLGTLGLALGLSITTPAQAIQATLNQNNTNATILVAQNLRQRQERNLKNFRDRQQNIRQDLIQRQQRNLKNLRNQGVNPAVIQQRRDQQREVRDNLRDRQQNSLENFRDRQRDVRQQVREERFDRRLLTERQRRFYNDYINSRNRDYYRDRYWLNRNYYGDRAFWSGPGYWYDRDYWGQRGYSWDNDVVGGIIGGLIQGAIGSAISPRNIYTNAPQILSYNQLRATACEPGTVVILLPKQQVVCAYPTSAFAPGTYRVIEGYELAPAVVDYRY